MARQVFTTLGQNVLPKVFGKLSNVGLTDFMDVKGETVTAGSGGGRIKGASPCVYKDIPVVFEIKDKGYRTMSGDQLGSNQDYILKFPTHNENGVRYSIDPNAHRLHIKARLNPGDEPAKVFRITAIRDVMGNIYEAECVREDAE